MKITFRHMFHVQSLVAALLLSLSAQPALAAAKCYSPAETTAEQALRVHSELLVIAVSCGDAFRRPDLFNDYVRFTNRNARDLSGYEKIISTRISNQKRFDEWRTLMANSVAARAAMMDTRDYCRRHVGTLSKALALKSFSAQGVENMLVKVPEARNNLSRPACSGDNRVAARAE